MGACLDGLTIFGVARSGSLASPGSQFQLKFATDFTGTQFEAGDIAFLLDMANNNAAPLPTFVTPSGWTSVTNTSGADGSGFGVRANMSYRVLTTGNLGAVFTGMNGVLRHRKAVLVCKMSRPIQAVSVIDQNIAYSATNPTGFTLTGTANPTQNVLVVGLTCTQNAIGSGSFPWSPGAQGSNHLDDMDAIDGLAGSLETTRMTFSYWPYGYGTRQDHFIDLGDNGDSNCVAGLVLGLS